MRSVYAFLPLTIVLVLSIFLSSCKNPNNSSAPSTEGSAYARTLADLEKEIISFRSRAENLPNSWLALDLTVQKYLQRAQLTSNYQDYEEAQDLLQKAFALSGDIGGPHMTRASLNFSLHRLPLVDIDLGILSNKFILNDPERARILGLQADLNFYRGNFDLALSGYQKALAFDSTPSNLFRMAFFYWHTGKFEVAENYLDLALEKNKGASAQLAAFLNLHKGLFDLDRGRYKDALAHYKEADELFSGWWLIHEHIAEIYSLQNQFNEAKDIYEHIVATTGNPEFMDALASIAHAQGDHKTAKNWISRAQRAYEKQLATFPEAAYGHALSHYLTLTNQPQEALRLAKANYELRPYGEAQIGLAQAYFLAGETQRAGEVIEQTLASAWSSAELHASAAIIFNQLGDLTLAQVEANKALAINPFALDDLSWLGSL